MARLFIYCTIGKIMDGKDYFLPTGKEAGDRATHATQGGSLMELLKATRGKPKAKGMAETTTEEHTEPARRIRKWIMDTKSIGRVELVYDENKPDQAVVASVKYRSDELKTLFGKRLRRKDILAVHEIKGVFEGRILG